MIRYSIPYVVRSTASPNARACAIEPMSKEDARFWAMRRKRLDERQVRGQ